MDVLLLVVLLAVGAAAWIGGSYFGMRRANRARTIQSAAERRANAGEADIQRLRVQLEQEKLLLERFQDPVILLGAGNEIMRMNATARTMLGTGAPALLRHPSFRNALERAQETGDDQFADITLPVPIARELHLSMLPVEGRRSRLLATLSDRTRERVVERMRADFVANASHELRTPLTSLIGFIDTLRGAAADDPAAQSRFLGIMAEQAQRMNRLIDDLLSLSRIELTEHVPPAGRVSIPALVDRLGAEFAPMLEAHCTELVVSIEPTLPHVVGDEDQLAQVLQNLLENAIKYGKEGGEVRLGVAAVARSGQAGLTIDVADQGIGIAATDIPRLTERFYRVNTHRSRAAGGTGLGLAIVKHIVNRHRGQLKIESVQGLGTTVTIWLRTGDAVQGNPIAPLGFRD